MSIFALSIKAQVNGVDKFNHLNFVEADDMQGIKDRKDAERYRGMGLLIDMPAGYQKLRKLSPFIFFGYGQIEHLVFNKDSTFLIGISVETVDSADYFSEEDAKLIRDKRAIIVVLSDDLTRSYLDQANLVDSPQFKPFRYSESRLKSIMRIRELNSANHLHITILENMETINWRDRLYCIRSARVIFKFTTMQNRALMLM